MDITCEGDGVYRREDWEEVRVEQRLGRTELEGWPEDWSRIRRP